MDDCKVFSWCGIPLFTWQEWDTCDTDTMIFYDCKVEDNVIKELVRQYYLGHPEISSDYHHVDIMIGIDGRIQIDVIGNTNPTTKVVDTYTVFDDFIIYLPEFHITTLNKIVERFASN